METKCRKETGRGECGIRTNREDFFENSDAGARAEDREGREEASERKGEGKKYNAVLWLRQASEGTERE